MDNEGITDSNLLLPQITKYRGTDTKNLHSLEINLSRFLWIEASLGPHKAKGHREPNQHRLVDKIVPEKRKGPPPNICSADFLVN